MNILKDLFSGGASQLVDSIGNTLDKVITTKGEKMQMDNEIRKAEMNFQLETQKLSVEERRLLYQDLDSARSREKAVQESANATKLGKNISSYLAIGATTLCFIMFYILVFCHDTVKDPAVKDIVIYILGVLSALLTQIYSYYFGSSAGSADKSKTLAQALGAKKD